MGIRPSIRWHSATVPHGPRARLRGPARATARRSAPAALALVEAAVLLLGSLPGVVADVSAAEPNLTAGFDVSWPNCGREFPAATVLAVVGVTGGKPFTQNPCLRDQYLTARRDGAVWFYLNLNKPRGSVSMHGPAGACSASDWMCRAYNYGWHAASSAWRVATAKIGAAHLRTRWWLDVETTNSWTANRQVNARVIAGALAYLRSRGHATRVGIYSTTYQWRQIAGAYRPGVDVWYATAASSARAAAAYCAAKFGFTGGRVRMVQYAPVGIDRDYICR